jgi:hypothetical protein
MERSGQISSRFPWEGNTTFWCFSWFKYGVTLVEDSSVFTAE